MKNQLAPAIIAADKPVQRCPKCGSEKVWRIQRTVAEKIIYMTSEGKYAAKKYLCKTCRNTYLIHRPSQQAEDAGSVEPATDSLIVCGKCRAKAVTIAKFTAAQLKQQTDGGKTLFRKLKCNSCGWQSVVYREDFEKANRNEI
jgi:hypothetical protein